MKNHRLVAFAILALMTIPTAHAVPTANYDDDLMPILDKWLGKAGTELAGQEKDAEYEEAMIFFERAKASRDAGRFRTGLFNIETTFELARTAQLMEETADLPSDAERRTRVLERTRVWADEVETEWLQLRADVKELDGRLASLHSLERVLYAADIGIQARVGLASYDVLAKEFPKQPKFEEGYVLALVRASHTNLLNLWWADDILASAVALEGLEPRLRDEPWSNITRGSVIPRGGQVPPAIQQYEQFAPAVRANNESIMSVAFELVELRAQRLGAIQTIFGDASGRRDTLADATRNLGSQLNNTTMAKPISYGLQGIFTADAIDRADFTLDFARRNQTQIGTVLATWANLDYSGYVLSTLASISPIEPPAETKVDTKGTPIPVGIALIAVAAAALTMRKRGNR